MAVREVAVGTAAGSAAGSAVAAAVAEESRADSGAGAEGFRAAIAAMAAGFFQIA